MPKSCELFEGHDLAVLLLSQRMTKVERVNFMYADIYHQHWYNLAFKKKQRSNLTLHHILQGEFLVLAKHSRLVATKGKTLTIFEKEHTWQHWRNLLPPSQGKHTTWWNKCKAHWNTKQNVGFLNGLLDVSIGMVFEKGTAQLWCGWIYCSVKLLVQWSPRNSRCF